MEQYTLPDLGSHEDDGGSGDLAADLGPPAAAPGGDLAADLDPSFLATYLGPAAAAPGGGLAAAGAAPAEAGSAETLAAFVDAIAPDFDPPAAAPGELVADFTVTPPAAVPLSTDGLYLVFRALSAAQELATGTAGKPSPYPLLEYGLYRKAAGDYVADPTEVPNGSIRSNHVNQDRGARLTIQAWLDMFGLRLGETDYAATPRTPAAAVETFAVKVEKRKDNKTFLLDRLILARTFDPTTPAFDPEKLRRLLWATKTRGEKEKITNSGRVLTFTEWAMLPGNQMRDIRTLLAVWRTPYPGGVIARNAFGMVNNRKDEILPATIPEAEVRDASVGRGKRKAEEQGGGREGGAYYDHVAGPPQGQAVPGGPPPPPPPSPPSPPQLYDGDELMPRSSVDLLNAAPFTGSMLL